MVELFKKRLESGSYLTKILYPAFLLHDLASNVDLDADRMTMQARTLVFGWQIGQSMCYFDGEYFEYVHDAIIGICLYPRVYPISANREINPPLHAVSFIAAKPVESVNLSDRLP